MKLYIAAVSTIAVAFIASTAMVDARPALVRRVELDGNKTPPPPPLYVILCIK
ncbi:hypothetical protein BDF19DRAFT_465807 [Syncephalis fuscata]|nr:hypothetical protein BDF19DRAFT_465807 [Syncephalis fuscata]